MNADEPIRADRPDPLVPESTGSGTSGTHADGDWGPDGHLGWRLSALLDSELAAADELRAREHLEGCAFCEEEFAEVMSARAFVRGLGDVEPPQGYVDRVLTRIHRRNQVRFGLASLVSIAAIWIVVLLVGAGLALPQIEPDVDAAGSRHALALASPERIDDASGVRAIDDAAVAGVDAPYELPDELASSYTRVGAWEQDGHGVQGLYRSGGDRVSVFEQEGGLEWGSLPDGGRLEDIDGERAWIGTVKSAGGPDRHVLVMTEYPVVFTVVSTDSAEAVLAVARDLPDPQAYSWSDRVQNNVDRWFDDVGL